MASDAMLGRGRVQSPPPRGRVGEFERLLSMAGGGALLAYGVKQRSLGSALLAVAGSYLVYRGASGHCAISAQFQIPTATEGVGMVAPQVAGPITVEEAITIDRPAADLYQFWRDVENLPRLMSHLKSVTRLDDQRSHWVAKALLGQSVEWDARITQDQPNQLIAWRAVEEADVANAGWVRFTPAPDGRGTEVRVYLEYAPPGGSLGAVVAKLFGEEPSQQVQDDLRHFKQMMETGQIVTTTGQTSGRDEARAANDEAEGGDVVTEASAESFPASDAPSWVSSKREHPTTSSDPTV